jgi:protein SCO1/2
MFKKLLLTFFSLLLATEVAFASQTIDLNRVMVSATVLTPPKVIKPFDLKDSNGGSFTNQNLKGHWTFLFFGFTRCGYVCPTSMATLKQAYEKLEKHTAVPKPQVVFVSIDPERDDLQRIHRYVTSFNPNFKGATGNKPALSELTNQLGILYMKIVRKGNSSDNYDIDHSGTILLVNPEGELRAVFSMPHSADNIAKDYLRLAQA